MADQTPSRLGQILAAGDTDAIFLKVFSGEVLTAFENETVTAGHTFERAITSGKSAQFPVMGRGTAYYHTPGNEILGGTVKHNEKIIVIDDLLISPVFIAEIDEAKNHYDVRSHYSMETGRVLAETFDRHNLQVGVLAARTAVGNIPGETPGGTVITEAVANDFNDPDKLAAAIYLGAQRLREKNVPLSDAAVFLPWQQYYALVQSGKAINRDFGGNGSYAEGAVWRVAGLPIIGTNQLPNTNVTTGTVAAGTGDRYLGDFTKVRGLIMHKSAVGVLKLMNLSTRMDYDPRRLGHQIVSKMAVGHGVLRPEAAIELRAF